MKKINGYDEAKAYAALDRLPLGGYIVQILDAKEVEYRWGSVLQISFDIMEGEYKGFFTKNYKEQISEDKKWKGTYTLPVPKDDGTEKDGWTLRKFKTVMNVIEASNPGFAWEWNEKKLKGKVVGALFNEKEYFYNGKGGFFTQCHSLVDTDTIKLGRFKIPEPTLLKKNGGGQIPAGFVEADSDEQIPF